MEEKEPKFYLIRSTEDNTQYVHWYSVYSYGSKKWREKGKYRLERIKEGAARFSKVSAENFCLSAPNLEMIPVK